jgi:hypothetical protein
MLAFQEKIDRQQRAVKYSAHALPKFFPDVKDVVLMSLLANALAHGFFKGEQAGPFDEADLPHQATEHSEEYVKRIPGVRGSDRNGVWKAFCEGFYAGSRSVSKS